MKNYKPYLCFGRDFIDIDNPKTENEKIFSRKLKEDSRYLDIYLKHKSISHLYKTGFLIEPDIEKPIMSRYVNKEKYKSKIIKDKRNFVLVTTGAFSPLHKGHIDMLKTAKDYLVDNGHNVCGAIISPSHDNYVDYKHNGTKSMFAKDRILEADSVLKSFDEDDWISVDSWESCMVHGRLNFTSVLDRLEASLRGLNIEFVHVLGSDNESFREAYNDVKEHTICIRRNNVTASTESVFEHKGINIVLDNKYSSESISSTVLRKEGYEPKSFIPLSDSYDNYELRNDLKESLSHYNVSPLILDDILNELKSILNKFVYNNPEIIVLNVGYQLDKFKSYVANKDKRIKILSNDIYLDGDINIGVSRKFKFLDSQIYSDTLVERSGKPIDFSHIPKGKYSLVDDDIATGFTKTQIISNLDKKAKIVDTLGLNDLYRKEKEYDSFDICDARDFILGSLNGGLMVTNESDTFRVPYLYPFVNLTTRASIPTENQLQFTKEIYKLNLKLYDYLNERNKKEITLGDTLDNNKWLNVLGYSKYNSITYIIKDLIKDLDNFYI